MSQKLNGGGREKASQVLDLLLKISSCIAFGKVTSHRIYPKQCTNKTGKKQHKYGLKTCFTYLGWPFRVITISENNLPKLQFLSSPG